MKLKNILLVVEDVERSRKFYHDLFGLDVILDLDGNMLLTEGLVLQDARVWERLMEKPVTRGGSDAELYFEETEMDDFLKKLDAYPGEIRFLHPPKEHEWGQRVVRLYDPDGHLIEVGEPMEAVARRLYKNGLSLEETAAKTQYPLEYIKEICR